MLQQLLTLIPQENIDKAFAKEPRLTNMVLSWKDYYVTYLHKKVPVAEIGVIKEPESYLQYTDIERTLLDITIRLEYAGGVEGVFAAYKSVKDRVNTDKLLSYLQAMKLLYPYHQSIGFYLERAGYLSPQYQAFHGSPIQRKFYIQNAMKEKMFDEKWSIYYPIGVFDNITA
jgi:hypothetical protein